jgi:hypothetical protein
MMGTWMLIKSWGMQDAAVPNGTATLYLSYLDVPLD